jgi:uncharacterized protein YdaU (DUF1376 family)
MPSDNPPDQFNGAKYRMQSGFHFFIDRFERSCDRVGMSDTERMAYIRILAQLYSTGGHLQSVDEVRSSAKISRHNWKNFAPKVFKLLQLEPEGWTHPVVIDTLARSQRISEERSAAARRRWDKVRPK